MEIVELTPGGEETLAGIMVPHLIRPRPLRRLKWHPPERQLLDDTAELLNDSAAAAESVSADAAAKIREAADLVSLLAIEPVF